MGRNKSKSKANKQQPRPRPSATSDDEGQPPPTRAHKNQARRVDKAQWTELLKVDRRMRVAAKRKKREDEQRDLRRKKRETEGMVEDGAGRTDEVEESPATGGQAQGEGEPENGVEEEEEGHGEEEEKSRTTPRWLPNTARLPGLPPMPEGWGIEDDTQTGKVYAVFDEGPYRMFTYAQRGRVTLKKDIGEMLRRRVGLNKPIPLEIINALTHPVVYSHLALAYNIETARDLPVSNLVPTFQANAFCALAHSVGGLKAIEKSLRAKWVEAIFGSKEVFPELEGELQKFREDMDANPAIARRLRREQEHLITGGGDFDAEAATWGKRLVEGKHRNKRKRRNKKGKKGVKGKKGGGE